MAKQRGRRSAWFAVGGIVCTSISGPAPAADQRKPSPDKSVYGLLDPTPDDALRTFTPDRPARASNPFTIDAGRFQIESDFVNYTFSNQQGASTRMVQTADPVLKVGVTNFMDVEVGLGGFVDSRTTDNPTGTTLFKGQGFGDVTLTTKFNLIGNEGGTIAFALAPYVILPSGTRDVSAGQIEGGLIAPLALNLPQDFTLTLQTEVDALANVNGPGTHAAFTNIVNVSHAIPGFKDLTGTAELYSSLTTEPHAPDQYTVDLALAYLVETNTQLDVGTNIGLNRGAPDYQVYSGITHRF